jgi:hypothetical protein
MAAKPTFAGSIPGESLRSRLPARARQLLRGREFAGTTLDLLVFPYSSDAVITSRALEKALAKIGKRVNALVVVGWDFTVEARTQLDAALAVVLSNREFGWTDASWMGSRQDRLLTVAGPDLSRQSSVMLDASSLAVARDFLLNGMAWDLSRPHWMENQRRHIAEKMQADSSFAIKLREAALEALKSKNATDIQRGLTALTFVGTAADLAEVERLKTHPEPSICKDAGTCLYELKRLARGA